MIGNELASWDEHQLIVDYANQLVEEGLYEDAAFNAAATGYDLWEEDWQCLCDQLTEIMENRGLTGLCYAEVQGFGWRSLDGQAWIVTETGKELLQAILPKTDCTFHIYEYTSGEVQGLAINNRHHDSPMGKEWYYILPARYCDVCEERLTTDQGVECSGCGMILCDECYKVEVENDTCWECDTIYQKG